jgi:kinesin family protein 11
MYIDNVKNIRNKPEINQKMTKRALIREYVNEIERLKADLIATREKNGIFMSKETYENLNMETSNNQTQIHEQIKSIAAKVFLFLTYCFRKS